MLGKISASRRHGSFALGQSGRAIEVEQGGRGALTIEAGSARDMKRMIGLAVCRMLAKL
jgi:hypothetical protein